MTLRALREDALRTATGGAELRLSLPWIRSLPLAGVDGIRVSIDGDEREFCRPEATPDAWWHIQDRLVLSSPDPIGPGRHRVSVSMRLTVPYLPMGDAPLRVPVSDTAELDCSARLDHAGQDIR